MERHEVPEPCRGMEFLYSLNRLNVATSRTQGVVIIVGSPKLLGPHRQSPRQDAVGERVV